jgi:hypothetical protein
MTGSAAGNATSRESAGAFGIALEIDGRTVIGRYRDVNHEFEERFEFGAIAGDRAIDERLARLLVLAASLSYYKAVPTTDIEIEFLVTTAERDFLAEVIRYGLAEFAYTNDLPAKLHPTIHFVERDEMVLADNWNADAPPLVPVGGGKDSVVSIEVLKSVGWHPTLFSVNRHESIDRCVAVSGLEYVSVSRVIDRRLLDLNAAGAPNGHVPVTAINSLVALITADLLGLGSVVLSNERSANSGNVEWDGIEVNHQWSKGLAFENLLRATLTALGFNPDRYFSLLRGSRELDIAAKFAEYPEYFSEFTSCNRAFRMDPNRRSASWCGECPKCLFVFLILAPVLDKAQLVGIFGFDLLDTESNIPLYEEILGVRGFKPFECVGEIDEAIEALASASRREDWRDSVVVRELLPRVGAIGAQQSAPAPDNIPTNYQAAKHELLGH